MRTLALRHFIMWLRLDGMNHIGKLDGILDEEDGDVVPDDIPVTLGRIHLDGEPAHIPNCVCTAFASLDSGKSKEERCLPAGIGQDTRSRHIFSALEELEGTESSRPAGMHDTLRDTLVVKAHNLDR